MALARQGTDAEGMREFCPTWTFEQRQLRAEWLHTCDERAVLASFHGFQEDDFFADAGKLSVPSLLVTAERGDVVRDEDVEELRRAIPSMTHVRVPNAGHMIPWDNESGFYEALGDFLGTSVTKS
jgi:N-formylmaleamate deformylase